MNYRTEPMLTLKAERARSLDTVFGPAPVNVFTELRKALNLSHAGLALQCHVSKQALIRLEQGTFISPLPSVVDFYVKRHGYNELTILDAYEHYRAQMRTRNRKLFGPLLTVSSTQPIHPLRQLRCSVTPSINPSELAKAICVPQATLQHFERKWRVQQSVPKEFQLALHALGYTNLQISGFCRTYEEWRQLMLGEGVRLNDQPA